MLKGAGFFVSCPLKNSSRHYGRSLGRWFRALSEFFTTFIGNGRVTLSGWSLYTLAWINRQYVAAAIIAADE